MAGHSASAPYGDLAKGFDVAGRGLEFKIQNHQIVLVISKSLMSQKGGGLTLR
jgi:hypothetical protein